MSALARLLQALNKSGRYTSSEQNVLKELAGAEKHWSELGDIKDILKSGASTSGEAGYIDWFYKPAKDRAFDYLKSLQNSLFQSQRKRYGNNPLTGKPEGGRIDRGDNALQKVLDQIESEADAAAIIERGRPWKDIARFKRDYNK